jgi:hypothetical protein
VAVIDLASSNLIVTIPTGGSTRADELAYDPVDDLILIGNGDDSPPFLTFISLTGQMVVGKIRFPSASGLEQPLWDPTTKHFYVSVPATDENPGGEIDVIDPISKGVIGVYPTPSCRPSGLSMGPNDQFVIGCRQLDAITFIMSAVDGRIVASITQVGGTDQAWYNAGDRRYYLAAEKMTTDGKATSPSAPVVGVIDAMTNTWVKNIPIPVGDTFHNVAVDSASNRAFVPCGQAGLLTLQVD